MRRVAGTRRTLAWRPGAPPCDDGRMTTDIAPGVIAFAWLALAMTLAPGSDTVFVIRSSLRDGWRSGVAAALGIVCGVILWGGLAGVGVALLLVRFPVAYTLVAVAGGVYLVVLAVLTLRAARGMWRSADATEAGIPVDDRLLPAAGRTRAATFSAGLLTNLLNPKIGVFYLSVMPGLFVGQALTLWLGLLLGGIHALLGVLWLSLVAVLANWARRVLLGARARAVLEAICGVLLLTFGVFVIAGVLAHAG